MKNLVKTTLLALTLSTTMVLADGKNTTMLDINKALPQTITAVENPVHPQEHETVKTTYSPQQKAQIVGLQLTAEAGQNALPQTTETVEVTYSPLQKASIVGLKLTAYEDQNEQLQVAESASSAYSPLQKAKIVGLVLTAE